MKKENRHNTFNKEFGNQVRNTSEYILNDIEELKDLTVSRTMLHSKEQTRGHKHDGIEEVYVFMQGRGVIQVDNDLIPVEIGSTVLIPAGRFHKVINYDREDLIFVSIFQKYKRE